MPCYSVLDVTPTSADWIPDYLPAANARVAAHGGRYIARTASHEQLEGAALAAGLRIIIEWPARGKGRSLHGGRCLWPASAGAHGRFGKSPLSHRGQGRPCLNDHVGPCPAARANISWGMRRRSRTAPVNRKDQGNGRHIV
ncbi:DUF1330 domain-containing protein [Jannaschia sp. 2305UL9-9]|uniref:DUF1330 domain-containing protein n=1 Tax=Jannaschia sp. 2305UL9-9 TaxID=3121638 RepID=UPI003526FA04